jgi:hypothetical protein
MTPDEISKEMDKAVLEMLQSGRKMDWSDLAKDLEKKRKFVEVGLLEAKRPEVIEKEWCARKEMKNALAKYYPPHIQEKYIQKLESPYASIESIQKELCAEWMTAEIEALPDTSFALIFNGARHFPIKDKDGKVSVRQLQEAIDQLPKTALPIEQLAFARKALQAAAKEKDLNLQETDYLIDPWSVIFDLKTRNINLEKQLEIAKNETRQLIESIANDIEIIPNDWVLRSWDQKPKKSIEKLKERLSEASK